VTRLLGTQYDIDDHDPFRTDADAGVIVTFDENGRVVMLREYPELGTVVTTKYTK
jgi:hypothetical protein